MDVTETGCKGADWIRLSQGRKHWQAVTNNIMKLRVPYKARISFTS